VTAPAVPVRFEPEFERPEEDEAQTSDGVMTALRRVSETTFKHSGHALRSVHAKSHGLLKAQLHVLEGLPPWLAQGIFSTAGCWPLVMRLSTIPGDLLDDRVSTPRGLALKVIGVDGARLEGSELAVTQNFVFVNGPAFSTSGVRKFLSSLKLVALTTDKAPRSKIALAATMRGAEKLVEAFGAESGALKALGGHPLTHILGETFYSQVPMLFGPYMAKLSVVPVSPDLLRLTGLKLDLHDKPNALRDAVSDFFASGGGEWELRAQLCTDLAAMPIEDASVPWPESLSPYVAVARIVADPQVSWSETLSAAVDDGMSFSPWQGVQAHRPIGSVMRVRKEAYRMSAEFRGQHNGKRIEEPRHIDDWPEAAQGSGRFPLAASVDETTRRE
jgi:hypothetical protein